MKKLQKKQRLKNNDTKIKRIYNKEIQPALKDSLALKNIFMVPKIEKIVLNMGLGLDGADAKILKAC